MTKKAAKRVPKPKLSDNQKKRLIAEYKTGRFSENKLAQKYGIGRTQTANIVRPYKEEKLKTNMLINEEIECKSKLEKIKEIKQSNYTDIEQIVIDDQVDMATEHLKYTTNSLLKTQKLVNIGTKQLEELIKDNPGLILKKLTELGYLNQMASRTHTSLHGKNNVAVQQNTQINNDKKIEVTFINESKDS